MFWRHGLDLVVPRRCAACGQGSSEPLCGPCADTLPLAPVAGCCALCQRTLDTGTNDAVVGTPVCGPCRADASPLAACRAAVWLRGDVHGWIHRFKYPGRGLSALDAEAGAVVRHVATLDRRILGGPTPDAIVPIPLHPVRLRARGFNPSALLARAIAGPVHAPVDYDWLARVRDTPPQAGLGRTARRQNVAGAFACRPRGGPPPERIWLVDDVVTTGATLRSAAHALVRAGARQVVGLCVARTEAPGREA